MSGQAEYLIAAGAVLAAMTLTIVTVLVGLVYGALESRRKRTARHS